MRSYYIKEILPGEHVRGNNPHETQAPVSLHNDMIGTDCIRGVTTIARILQDYHEFVDLVAVNWIMH